MVGRCVIGVLLLPCCTQATKEVNNMTVKMPYQCFINGQFEDAENGKTYDTVNPSDGSVSHVNILTHESTRTHTHTHRRFSMKSRLVLLKRV